MQFEHHVLVQHSLMRYSLKQGLLALKCSPAGEPSPHQVSVTDSVAIVTHSVAAGVKPLQLVTEQPEKKRC